MATNREDVEVFADHPLWYYSDQLLHMHQFMVTWIVFFGAGSCIYVAYIVKKKDVMPLAECLGFHAFRDATARKSLYMDAVMYGIGKIFGLFILVPFAVLNLATCALIVSALQYVIPDRGLLCFNYLWAAACTIFMFLVEECAEYTYHLAEHKFPVLWEFHKVHHSAHQLNPLTAKRIHPVSTFLASTTRGIMTGVAAGGLVVIFDISAAEALALSLVASKIFIIATLDPLKHSHFCISLGIFDRILVSPHMHQIHHSKKKAHWDKNFGTTISLFDWIFGTAYKPSRDERPIYGISGHSDEQMRSYNTFYGAYVRPFIRSARIARDVIGRGSKNRSMAVPVRSVPPDPALDLGRRP
jgi:sterol desaturase/sphingolipid hydroxylase (fatty acid hydroxylase superfamily)